MPMVLVRVDGYTRKDGSIVKPHMREVVKYANEKHRGQTRGDGVTPYIKHPVGVARILAQAGIKDNDVLFAAVLHDTIEDTKTTKKDLEKRFGGKVAGLVTEVTNDPNLEGKASKQAQIDHGATRSNKANWIKTADKTFNLIDMIDNPPNWTVDRKRCYANHAKAVVDAMPSVPPRLRLVFNAAYNKAVSSIS